MNAVASVVAPTVSVPSISSAAMLVELNISVWTGRKRDQKATDSIEAMSNAMKGVANVTKKLLGDCAELDAVVKFTANARNMHYAMTMPWSDSGLRLLPTTQYFKYVEAISACQNETERLVNVFLDAYKWEIDQAKLRLGHLFNSDDYPTINSLKDKFRFKVNYIPLPSTGDFRLDIGNEAQDALADQYSKFYSEQLGKAMNDIWQRVFDALSKMSERLDYGPADTKKIFRDSLVDNVTDLIELLDACNITKDPRMTQAKRDIEQAISGITPDALREDSYLRAETKRTVDAIIKGLPGLGL